MNVEQPRERIRCHIVGMAVNPLPLEWLLLTSNLSLRITRTKRKAESLAERKASASLKNAIKQHLFCRLHEFETAKPF